MKKIIKKQQTELTKIISEKQEQSIIYALQHKIDLASKLREKIEAELATTALESIEIINGFLKLPNIEKPLEALILCRKADYYRYLAESQPKGSEERKENETTSQLTYELSFDICKTEYDIVSRNRIDISRSNIVASDVDRSKIDSQIKPLYEAECSWILLKLTVTLNYAVFLYEIVNNPQKAIEIGRSLFVEVINYFTDNAELGLVSFFLTIMCIQP